MKAVWLEKHGPPENLKVAERPYPKPKADEVVLEVRAAGLNHLDIWVRVGGARPFPLPVVPGTDVAGVVREVGEVAGVKAGDEVVVYPSIGCNHCPACENGIEPLCSRASFVGAHRDGGFAEYVAVPAKNCVPKPPSLSWIEAAAVPVNYVTAWHMLTARAGLQPGETVLVQAAGSGVSSAAIQICKTLGARIIATSSTEAKLAHARRLGADHVLNYKTDDVGKKTLELTGGAGCQVVFDHVGKATYEADIKALARGGRLVTCGTTTGAEVNLNLAALYRQSQSVIGSTLGSRGELRSILELMERRQLGRPVIDRVAGLAGVAEAHRYLESGAQTGKIVIDPRS